MTRDQALREVHRHRRPRKRDFEGKTVKRFVRTADNIWKLYFTDGTSFAIQAELHYGLAIIELCEMCALAALDAVEGSFSYGERPQSSALRAQSKESER